MKALGRVILIALVVALLAFCVLVAAGWLWPGTYVPVPDGIVCK